jgi:hypothetical protein
MHRAILAATVVFLGALPALAHGDDDDRYRGYSAHSRYHEDLEDAHERAHDEGFSSRRDHRSFHRALRYLHRGYHEDRRYYWWRRYE